MVLIKYCTSITIVPLNLSEFFIHSSISSKLSLWAKTLDASIKSALFLNFLVFFLSKNLFIVLIPNFCDSLQSFKEGSNPKIFLKPSFLNRIILYISKPLYQNGL